MEYAIVDIETTGGHATGNSIIEIAIVIYDGISVKERYETLINPQRPIPQAIGALTGIYDDMVRDSPLFDEVAGKIFSLLCGRVFVAHSVNFDYSFVRYSLQKAGYDFSAPRLCTVRLSRKVKPGLHSYSLGNLCNALGIAIEGRHRAGGDAAATVILFSKLMEWDVQGYIGDMLKKGSKEAQLPPHMSREDFERLPAVPGIYYFKDKEGKVIYVGKAVDIKKRVASHFSGNNPSAQRQHFMRSIYSVAYEVCATELMAFLLECIEIKRLWPPFNRALKRFEPKFGIVIYEDLNGFLRLAVGRLNKSSMCEHVFNQEIDAITFLRKLVEEYELSPHLCAYGRKQIRCEEEAGPDLVAEEYNSRVRKALDAFSRNRPSFAILDAGRHEDERSLIWIEQGRFYGMGYMDKDLYFANKEEYKDLLTPYSGNEYMVQLIFAYARKFPYKILSLG